MPEMHAVLRWPDGTRRRCYSPSLVLAEHLEEGATYRVDDLVRRARTALTEASARVEVRYGFPCGRAASALATVEADAGRFDPSDAVVVETLER